MLNVILSKKAVAIFTGELKLKIFSRKSKKYWSKTPDENRTQHYLIASREHYQLTTNTTNCFASVLSLNLVSNLNPNPNFGSSHTPVQPNANAELSLLSATYC